MKWINEPMLAGDIKPNSICIIVTCTGRNSATCILDGCKPAKYTPPCSLKAHP